MAAKETFVLKHPSGKHMPVAITNAARRDALLARGYTEVRGNPEPKAQPDQQRRSGPTKKAK